MKKIISILLTFSMLIGVAPALAENEDNFENIEVTVASPWENAEVEEEPSDSPSNGVYYKPDMTEEEENYEPIVHTEPLPDDIELSEEEFNLMGEEEPLFLQGLALFSTSSTIGTYDNIWKEMMTEQFGDDYLMPYNKIKSSQRISGNTNRLTIEETDLRLAGKNGLDFTLTRKHDNQDYSDVYSSVRCSATDTLQYKYRVTFKNNRTNDRINVAFYTEDEFYTYMYNGSRLKTLNTKKLKTYSNSNSGSFTFYDFSYIKTLMTDSTSYDLYTYDSSVDCRTFYDRHEDGDIYKLESRRILENRNLIGNGWTFHVPEVYLYQYSNVISTCRDDKDDEYKLYKAEYVGAFRDISGSVYFLKGNDAYKKYKHDGYENTYTSSFSCTDNHHLTFEKLFHTQQLDAEISYNFIVNDNNGYTYYLYNREAEEVENPARKQPISIVAVEDNYGNRITYKYSDSNFFDVNEVIDTYGRHIYINKDTTTGQTVVSYYDDVDADTKTITYTTSTLPSSTLDNDSPIKPKDVMRLTVTNQLGEKTIYDARQTVTCAVARSGMDNLTNYPDIYEACEETSTASNIERIIYPTGAETRYTYQCLYPRLNASKVLHSTYAVVGSYDLVDGNKQNEKTYELTNNNYDITITETNESEQNKSVRVFNADGLLTNEETKPLSGVRPYKKTAYTYTNNKPTTIVVNNNGLSVTTKYTYNNSYPDIVSSEQTDDKKISYTYHAIPSSLDTSNNLVSGKPQTITYSKKSGSSYVTDYIVSTELNDNKSVEYERVTQNNIIKSQSKYEYDAEGNVVAAKQWIKDTNGDGVLDESDECTTASAAYTDSAQKTQKVVTSVTDVLNADGTNEGDITNEYNINIYGSPMYYKDSYNTITTIEYDALNRPVKYNMPNGGTKTIEYNSTNNYTIVTDEAGIQYKNIYDKLGRIKEKQKKVGSNWSSLEKYSYDNAGRLTEKISGQKGAGKIKETYTYDILNRVTTRKVYENASTLLYTETYTYGANSYEAWTLKHTDAADGAEIADVKTYYDKYGQLVKTETISGGTTLTTQNQYDYLGRVTQATDARGNSTTYTYTYDGQVLTATNALNNTVSTQYDLAGRATSTTDARGNTTTTEYDKLGRAIKVTAPFDGTLNAITKTYYDKNSQVIKTAVRKDVNTYDTQEYRYDNMGNQTAVITGTGADKSVVKYEYDSANRLTKMTTGLSDETAIAGGSNTTYTYNAQGFLNSITDPMGQSEIYQDYDVYGNVGYVFDRNDNVMFYYYNAYGIRQENSWTGAVKLYTYNNLGQITHTKSENKTGAVVEEDFTYDAFGRLTSKTSTDGTVQNYTYDANSNVLTYSEVQNDVTKNSGTYEYDKLNRLTSVQDSDNIRLFAYDQNSNLTRIFDISDEAEDVYITYNKANLPTAYKSISSSGTRTYGMSYYLNGNKYQETNTLDNIAKTYAYNTAGQLSSENETKSNTAVYSTSYTYTPYGNRDRMSYTSGGTTEITDYTYDANNRLTNETSSVNNDIKSAVRYYYDNNGNTTAEQRSVYTTAGAQSSNMSKSGRSGGSTMKLYSYDEFNRLVQYNDDGAEATYTYGVDNLRASKTVNGTTTSYVWNGQNLASETKNDTTTVYYYDVLGINGSKTDNDAFVRYIKDPHGNVVATNKDGEAYGTYDYTAFGNQLESTDTTNPFRYCGEYYDEESGMTYLRNRYYDSSTGRFISEDPAKDGVNWYAYCENNPINRIDPDGLYDRDAAVRYAKKYSKPDELDVWEKIFSDDAPPVRFNPDCTNFVSWCLAIGGKMKMSPDWYFGFGVGIKLPVIGYKVTGSYSLTWTVSEEQFKAFTNCTGEFPNTNYANGNAICIHESKWISAAIEEYNIRPGDLIYFLDPQTNQMGHTAIIVSTDDGRIKYAQHNRDDNNADLGTYLDTHKDPKDYQYAFVVRISDDA